MAEYASDEETRKRNRAPSIRSPNMRPAKRNSKSQLEALGPVDDDEAKSKIVKEAREYIEKYEQPVYKKDGRYTYNQSNFYTYVRDKFAKQIDASRGSNYFFQNAPKSNTYKIGMTSKAKKHAFDKYKDQLRDFIINPLTAAPCNHFLTLTKSA